MCYFEASTKKLKVVFLVLGGINLLENTERYVYMLGCPIYAQPHTYKHILSGRMQEKQLKVVKTQTRY